MTSLSRWARRGAAGAALVALGACSNSGTLGNILGGVLGGGQQQQVSGTIAGVDTRNQQIFIRQTNGETVQLGYDSQTQIVYQNQNYPVTSLENGDQVTARVQATNNGGYYTDLVQVDQSVSTSGGTAGNVQTFQGTVRQVDRTNGWFTVDMNNYGTATVTLPYRPSNSDLSRFQNLRSGDYVRFYGVPLNNTRIELRQFY